ncbi:MAG: DUF2259 domain-containing protein [Treponema sp.]|nr:DUF2259 domain-containing protein [Treponema sp.]
MFHKKTLCTLAMFLFLGLSGLTSVHSQTGDVATFVDLGFSPDGRTYMFAQYGVQAASLRPWADLFIVDVSRNSFVSGGRVSYVHDFPVLAGHDGSGALYQVLSRNAALAERHSINYSFQGQPLFIALGDWSPYTPVEFRNFETGDFFRANLVSSIEASGTSLRSSFFINLERISADGSRSTYTVGSPHFQRPNISSYRIRQVLIAPRDGSMIFVIEMKRQEGTRSNIRYMVEALRL